jgi:hypothetical protein
MEEQMNVGKRIRTTVLAPLALGLTFATAAAAQTPPAQTQPATPPAQQATPPPTPTFSGTAGILLVQIKPGQEPAYEGLLGKLKEALVKNEKPERKQMAAGWKVYKSGEPMNGNTLYVHIIEPAVAGQDYGETFKLIYEVFPSETNALFEKTKEAFAGGGKLNLTLINDFGKP